MKHIQLLVLPILLFQFAIVTQSAVPDLINYQGYVTDTGGTAIGSGAPVNRKVTFRFWNHPTNSADANRLFSESQTVTINEGDFSVLIGQGIATGESTVYGTLSDVFDGTDVFLGITVDDGDSIDNEPEISPRQQIVTTAYAFRSKVADTVADGAVTTPMLASGAITSDKLAASAVTTSQLAAGSVTITNIAIDSIDTTRLADNSVSTNKIQAGAVTGAKVASGAISSDKLATNSVTSTQLATSSVYSAEIADGQVTSSDLGPGTITSYETLRIVRGALNDNGSNRVGFAGDWFATWYSTGTGVGYWRITFNPAFSGIPVVTANTWKTSNTTEDNYVVIKNITANYCELYIADDSYNDIWVPQQFGFTFIAIGPR